MEKTLDPKISRLSFDKEYQRGCFGGVVHVLRSYQWHHVKNIIPHKRIGGRRQIEDVSYSRLKSDADTGEAEVLLGAEVEDLTIGDMSDSSPTRKKSRKVRLKRWKAEEKSKEQDNSCPLPSIRSHFVRTHSIHHLEPTSNNLPDEVRENGIGLYQADAKTTESTWDPFSLKSPGIPVSSCNGCELCGTPTSMKHLSHAQLDELGRQLLGNALLQNKLDRAKESFSRKKSMDIKESSEGFPPSQPTEALDALEMYNVNKRLFHFRSLQASCAKRGLTKSDSFPLDDSSGRKPVKLSKLKCMQEVRFFDDSAVTVIKPDQEVYDDGPTSTNFTPDPFVKIKKRRFKDIKQRIKNAIKESRKEGPHISMDAIFHKLPHGSIFSKDVKREKTDKWKESVTDAGEKDSPASTNDDSNSSTPILERARLNRIRRTQSLNESLNRYSQLFELSFGRDTKQLLSSSLKLANESGGSTFGSMPKALGRISSLPDLESYCPLECDASSDALSSRTPTRLLVDRNIIIGSLGSSEESTSALTVSADNHTQLDAFVVNAKDENLGEEENFIAPDNDQKGLILDPNGHGIDAKNGMVNNLENVISWEGNFVSQIEQEIVTGSDANTEQPQLNQENIFSLEKLSLSAGPESNPRQILVNELVSQENIQDQSVMDSSSGAISNVDPEKVKSPRKDSYTDLLVQVDKKDEADFNYVKDVLKVSGFSVNECLGTWFSPDQPVDPSLFEEVETCSPVKSDCSGDEVGNNYDHQFLFDIINEVLIEIYDRSFTYWPRPLSCACHIRPLPTGYHVLEEVWTTISWYLNSQPKMEPLDYLVVRDLSKSDGWMNLQFDSECVGLELEEMILDDLLDEVISA